MYILNISYLEIYSYLLQYVAISLYLEWNPRLV